MDFTKNLTKPIICYIKDLCNTIDRLQYELSKIVSLVTYSGIGTLKNPVNDIYTKRIKIGQDSIRIDGDEINFDNSGRKITSTEIGTQEKPFETIYVKKIDADNEVDNFTVDGYLTVKGETTLGTDITTDTTVKGDLIVEGSSSLEGTVTLGTDITTDTTVKGDLTVEGTQTIFTSTLNPSDPSDPSDYDNSAVVIKGGVNIEKDLFVDGTIYGTVEGTIDTPNLNLTGFLTVEGQTTLKGGVDLGSTSSITNAVDIDGTGDLTMGTITMTGFSVDANGDVVSKSINNSSGGITNTGSIAGATTISASGTVTTTGTVTGGTLTDGTASITGGSITGASSITTTSLTLGGTALTATGADLNTYTLNTKIEDISSDGTSSSQGKAYVVVPKDGTVTAVYSVIDDTTSGGDAILAIFSTSGGTTPLGTITVSNGSGAGETDSTSLNNTVATRDIILIESNGGSTGNVSAVFTIEIKY